MSYGLQLKTRTTRLQPEGTHRFQAWVSDCEGLDPEIFVYQRRPALPGETAPDDRFVNVASVADMAEYPALAPIDHCPFFRLTSFDLVFRSLDTMDRTWQAIKSDISYLLMNKDKLDVIYTETTVDFNYHAYESSSSSSSSSLGVTSSSSTSSLGVVTSSSSTSSSTSSTS